MTARVKDGALHQTFASALEGLIADVKQDRSVLAAILCGSLSHDTVWARSDIDLVLVTIDDKKVDAGDIALSASGVNVHALLMPRTQFRQTVEGSLTNSFIHSFLAKGRLLYTHDPSIADLCDRLHDIGTRDTAIQLLHAATAALACVHKAHKWFLTRGDLDYTALWILYAATSLAQIEVIGRGLLADREVIPQALSLNTPFFKTVYVDMLNSKKTTAHVRAALDAIDAYLSGSTERLFAPVMDYLREAGEARAASEIEHHFERHFSIRGVTTACEYLADQGLIGKVSLPVHLTKRSNVDVQELAFVLLSR